MKIIALDVHTEKSQMVVTNGHGLILLEKTIATKHADLRREIAAISGRKRVVFENGGMSGLIMDALRGVADEIVACDATQNSLIAHAEDSCDERDARRLAMLSRVNALKGVYVPDEPFRTIRSLVNHEYNLMVQNTRTVARIKALCRRHGVSYKGNNVLVKNQRGAFLLAIGSLGRFQMESLYRQLDEGRKECVRANREVKKHLGPLPLYARLTRIPGIGPVTARTLIAWIVDPRRFKSWSALNAYSGLGLKHDVTNWKASKAHASRRGQRKLKRVLFIAARAAIGQKDNAFARRYEERIKAGWEDGKAIRDVARTMLKVAIKVWVSGEEYDDARVSVGRVQVAR
jgi:transposase